MKRQRRTLGLLLAWLAIALGAIGLGPQHASRSPSTSARSADSAQRPKTDSAKQFVSVGSLAWLAADRRSSAGSELALAINAEQGSYGERATATRRRRFAWTDDAPRACGARLGWSGCTAYRRRIDCSNKETAAGVAARTTSAHWMARAIAAVVRQSSSAFVPWLNSLASGTPDSPHRASRVSRRAKAPEEQRGNEQRGEAYERPAIGRTTVRELVL